jgi:chitinase
MIMKLLLILMAGWFVRWSAPAPAPAERAESGVASLLTRQEYERFFPHHDPLYSYESFIKAAAGFPLFAGEGSPELRKRELAAFFAHAAHETTNGGPGSPDGEYAWGLFYKEELGCSDGHCAVYNTGGTSRYKPAPAKSYYGRGPLQLSYAYNYGQAGADLGLPLLEKPELVSHDGVIAFRAALWFWMKTQPPKPSCHDVICGKWKPSAQDMQLSRRPGFGMTIDIINGGEECKGQDPAAKKNREDRIGFYRHFASLLKVSVEKDCDCTGMGTY